MVKIKICGIKNEKEAEYLNKYKVDFAGFVLFFPKSKRNISVEKAKEIFKTLNGEIKKVAVVVSPDKEQIKQIENAGFDYIQIHGEISGEILGCINIPVLKAFNVSDINELNKYEKYDKIAGYVFDAQIPGSGKTFDWSLIPEMPNTEKLFVLAGGLNPENVKKAIDILKPDVADVSSGVENDDGNGKNPQKIDLFVKAARHSYI